MLTNEVRFKVLKLLEANPKMSQRELGTSGWARLISV
jgi:hypothetical protein